MQVLALAAVVLYIVLQTLVQLVVKSHILLVPHIMEHIVTQVVLPIIAAMEYGESVECGQKYVLILIIMDTKYIHQFTGLRIQLNAARLGQVELAVQDAALLVVDS